MIDKDTRGGFMAFGFFEEDMPEGFVPDAGYTSVQEEKIEEK